MYTHLYVVYTVFSRQIRLKTLIAMKWRKNEKYQINVENIRETLYKLVRNLVFLQTICTVMAMQNKCL